ncbi:hypothetical protein CDAR_165811 [Caerostris darwini]|uniref:Uncharacterized protein n=1 Tax=Caerostris darwini TaxID=1538125 RepID=A0AAV4RX06_9ARAC|nr:hypothetical protein CDAR_165811 [Caerostris darwini]
MNDVQNFMALFNRQMSDGERKARHRGKEETKWFGVGRRKNKNSVPPTNIDKINCSLRVVISLVSWFSNVFSIKKARKLILKVGAQLDISARWKSSQNYETTHGRAEYL